MYGGFLAVGDPYLAIGVPFLVAGVPFHSGLAPFLSIGHSVASDEGAVLPSKGFEEG